MLAGASRSAPTRKTTRREGYILAARLFYRDSAVRSAGDLLGGRLILLDLGDRHVLVGRAALPGYARDDRVVDDAILVLDHAPDNALDQPVRKIVRLQPQVEQFLVRREVVMLLDLDAR